MVMLVESGPTSLSKTDPPGLREQPRVPAAVGLALFFVCLLREGQKAKIAKPLDPRVLPLLCPLVR